jgi:hypothetical protein
LSTSTRTTRSRDSCVRPGTSAVSAEVQARVDVEFALMRRLIADHAALVSESRRRGPEPWERSALAALLHAFYNGVENTLKLVAARRGGVPSSADWHAALLRRAAMPVGPAPALVSPDLAETLEEYMHFRHFFRHSYVFDLNWEKMRPLIEALDEVFGRFESQVRAYLAAVPDA